MIRDRFLVYWEELLVYMNLHNAVDVYLRTIAAFVHAHIYCAAKRGNI